MLTKCDLTFADMKNLISHKDIHNKESVNGEHLINKQVPNKSETVQTEDDKSVKLPIENKAEITPREEIPLSESSDGMNELLSKVPFTYDEKDQKLNEKLVEGNHLIPQVFREPFVGKCDPKSQEKLNSIAHNVLNAPKPFSFRREDGKIPSVTGLGHVMPFSCTEWGYNLNLKASQNKHSDLHTGRKPYNADTSTIPKVNFS